jgi:hypothetical protein
MENTITELMTNKGYPHILMPITNNELKIVSEKPVQVGDGFVFNSHRGADKLSATVYRVTEIKEERKAKGHYLKPTNFYNLLVNPVIEDVREKPIQISC